MRKDTMSTQTVLLTAHKGVDLHAASALLVMKNRLEGGDHLVNLLRCEMHTFWGQPDGVSTERLLDTGRFYNPNKHHYGVFTAESADPDWLSAAPVSGTDLSVGWPGQLTASDLDFSDGDDGLYDRLLGGHPAPGQTAVDVVSFPLGQRGPVLSGVLWRLVLSAEGEQARKIGHNLAIARSRKQGLLINPHMEAWLSVELEQA